MVAAAFCVNLAFSAVPTRLYVIYQQRDQISTLTITVVYAVYAVGVTVSLFLGGHVSDWMGRRRVLVPALAANAASALLLIAFRACRASSSRGSSPACRSSSPTSGFPRPSSRSISGQGDAGPVPAPVPRIAAAMSDTSSSLSSRVAAGSHPSTCSGLRAPTIAPVTPGTPGSRRPPPRRA